MANTLRHFPPSEVIISKEQASRILRFFFPGQPATASSLTAEDTAFAQALLVEAVDASKEMGYVHIIFDKAYMKMPNDFSFIKDIAEALGKQALQNWFRHASKKDLDDPQIYDAVRGRIAVNFNSVWAIRNAGGGLDY